jgi:hypothetical protein
VEGNDVESGSLLKGRENKARIFSAFQRGVPSSLMDELRRSLSACGGGVGGGCHICIMQHSTYSKQGWEGKTERDERNNEKE